MSRAMSADNDQTINLKIFIQTPRNADVQVPRAVLRDAMDIGARRGPRRKLSADAHIEIAERYKRGEFAYSLAPQYGVAPSSITLIVSRVERAAEHVCTVSRKTHASPPTDTEPESITIEAGWFLRELLSAVRPLLGAAQVRRGIVLYAAARLERLANIMRRRAEQSRRSL
jgi:hypothetical protein